MFYISGASTISHQPTFQNAGFSAVIRKLEKASTLLTPDFKEYIDAGLLRRMSKILRISVACAKDSLTQAGLSQPDSIVVGTGLGCLMDTEKFLNNFLTIEGLLPPTAFIQSTHNTIAGQISLSLGNHGYNMTHTQNSLSFEHALLDAMLLLGEDNNQVLVGAADEYIDILDTILANLGATSQVPLATGASFFVISSERSDHSLACIKDVEPLGLAADPVASIKVFLEKNETDPASVDQVLFADSRESGTPEYLASLFDKLPDNAFSSYPLYSGLYPGNSSFALHLAVDKMRRDNKVRCMLICNHLINGNLGLTLLQSVEA